MYKDYKLEDAFYDLEEVDQLQSKLSSVTEFIEYLSEKAGVLYTTADMLLESRRFEILRGLLFKPNG